MRVDKSKIALSVGSTQQHAEGLDAHQLSRCQVCYNNNVFAYHLFRLIVLGNTADNSAYLITDFYLQLEQLFGFFNL